MTTTTIYGKFVDMGNLPFDFDVPTTQELELGAIRESLEIALLLMLGDKMGKIWNPSSWKFTFEGKELNEANVANLVARVSPRNAFTVEIGAVGIVLDMMKQVKQERKRKRGSMPRAYTQYGKRVY